MLAHNLGFMSAKCYFPSIQTLYSLLFYFVDVIKIEPEGAFFSPAMPANLLDQTTRVTTQATRPP
jgi:hypothetical protein